MEGLNNNEMITKSSMFGLQDNEEIFKEELKSMKK